MSYSLSQKCWICKKQKVCMDGTIIQSAVSIIHALGSSKGHLGSGSITHDCTSGFEDSRGEQVQYEG